MSHPKTVSVWKKFFRCNSVRRCTEIPPGSRIVLNFTGIERSALTVLDLSLCINRFENHVRVRSDILLFIIRCICVGHSKAVIVGEQFL